MGALFGQLRDHEYMERLLPDARLSFAAEVTPLAPVRWWLPPAHRSAFNLSLAAGHKIKEVMRAKAEMAAEGAAQQRETVKFSWGSE